MLNTNQFPKKTNYGAPLRPESLNPATRASVPKKGSGITSKEGYLKSATQMGQTMAAGKAQLRNAGKYNWADAGVKLYGSSSKQKRAAAKLAGKPPVNQRKAI